MAKGIKTRCVPDRREWHRWFAWRPVVMKVETKGGHICVTQAFWTTVDRRWDSFYERWEYLEIADG